MNNDAWRRRDKDGAAWRHARQRATGHCGRLVLRPHEFGDCAEGAEAPGPRVQLFVFSRATLKPFLPLPTLNLLPLSFEQVHELEQIILDDGSAKHVSIAGMMPPMLRTLCGNPLLLRLALDYWKRKTDFPRKIEFLFRSWLESALEGEPSDHVSVASREHALMIVSRATAVSPITSLEAIALFQKSNLSPAILNQLIACDAIRSSGSVLEVQHEALADYLRAKDLASL